MVPMRGAPRARPWEPRSCSLVLLSAVIALAFATGVFLVPHSPVETLVYDVILFNVVPLPAIVLCLRAARRVLEERFVWWGAAAAWALNLSGNLLYGLVVAPLDPQPFPSLADGFWVATYAAL